MHKKLILIAGPTASGKSALAIKLCKKIGGEIINADSMQVYKEFSVLSSRPSKIEIQRAKHHLYGIISAKNYFSTGAWLKLVKKKILRCLRNKKIPILVGGTGLYFNAIIKGISKIPKIDSKTRNKVRILHKNLGSKKFYSKLILIDPLVKDKILPSDTQRVLRAYEVKIKTKKSFYEWAAETKPEFSDYDIKKIFLDVPRNILLKNISLRTEKMFKSNCIKEVEIFLKLKVKRDLSCNKLIGVQEINEYLSGLITRDQAKNLINIKTRQYAKRQNTWSRGHMGNWTKLYSEELSILVKKVLKAIS